MASATDLEGADVADGNELSYLDTTDPSAIASQIPSNPYVSGSGLVGGVGIVGLNGQAAPCRFLASCISTRVWVLPIASTQKRSVHARLWHLPSSDGNVAEPIPPRMDLRGNPRRSMRQPTASARCITSRILSRQACLRSTATTPRLSPGTIPAAVLSVSSWDRASPAIRASRADAYQEIWSLDVQRELPSHFVVTVAYAGSVGIHLYGATQI